MEERDIKLYEYKSDIDYITDEKGFDYDTVCVVDHEDKIYSDFMTRGNNLKDAIELMYTKLCKYEQFISVKDKILNDVSHGMLNNNRFNADGYVYTSNTTSSYSINVSITVKK